MLATIQEKVKELHQFWQFRKYINQYAAGEITTDEMTEWKEDGLYQASAIEIFPMAIEMWGALILGLIEKHGPAVVQPIRQRYLVAGREHGAIIEKVTGPENYTALYDMWADYGYGEIMEVKIGTENNLREIEPSRLAVEFTDEDTMIQWKVKNSAESVGVQFMGGELDYPGCIFEPPYLQGVYETWFGRSCTMEETTCESMGDDHCTWVFYLNDQEDTQ